MGSSESIDHYIRSYGDLLYDLCESLLANAAYAQYAYRSILKKIKSGSRFQKYSSYERSWVLKVACSRLIYLDRRQGNRVSPQDQIKLDANGNVANRLKQFDTYFHRLRAEDQILLLLKDKYGIPYSEIASALGIPENSLKIQRQQALRALEEWLWNGK